MAQIRANVFAEISTLLLLFQAQKNIGNYNYREALLTLFRAKCELDSWRQNFSEHVKGKSFGNDSLKFIKSGVFSWLQSFQTSLHSKLTFYFYNIFQKNEKKSEGKWDLFARNWISITLP